MSFTVTREPLIGCVVTNSHTVILKISVRAKMDIDLPMKKELENKIASDLLHMKRLDEGAAWDVASVILDDNEIRVIPALLSELEQCLRTILVNSELRGALDRIFLIKESIRKLLGLESQC